MGRLSRAVRAALPIAALALAPSVAPAQGPPHPMPPGSAPPQHAAAPLPFYRERTFLVLVGVAAAGSGALVYRVVQRRRRTPAGFVSEAVLVVARELRDAGFAHRFVGFCSLKGFPGLHRVFALEGEAPQPATRRSSSS